MNIKTHQFLLNTFVEINECLGFGVENEIRKELFQQQLIKEQKKEERDNFTNPKEFLNRCLWGYKKLRDYVFSVTEMETTSTENIKSSIVLKHWNDYGKPILSEQTQREIDSFDVNNYLVPVSEFINKPRTYISNNDILFIGDCITTLSFEENLKSIKKGKENNPSLISDKKEIFDFIQNVKDEEGFLQDLKTVFPIEKGIAIKVMIELLQEEGIILIPKRKFKMFYEEFKNVFDQNIGSYTSINDVIFRNLDSQSINPIKRKLNPLIAKHKKL
jgi:hypothetical protein